jgi:large-conductance mechanosensitive channel
MLAHVKLQRRSILRGNAMDLQVTSVQHHAADAVIHSFQGDLWAGCIMVQSVGATAQHGKEMQFYSSTLITNKAAKSACFTVAAPVIVLESNDTPRSKSL